MEAYFSYIYRYILGTHSFVDKEGQYQFMEHITGLPPFIFYTFIGGLIMEFGKIIPIVIVFFINRFTMRVIDCRMVRLDKMLLYVFFVFFYTSGLFTFPIQNFTGFIIFYLIVIHLLFCKKRQNSYVGKSLQFT